MKLLIKYITKKSFGPFLIGLGGFIVFVSVEVLYQLSYIIVKNRVGFDKLLLLIYYYLPYFTAMGIPVGVLLSIFWTMSELSEKNELMAFQVHGISLKKLIIPFLLLAVILSGVAYILNDYLVPKYQVKIDEVMAKYIYKKAHAESYLVEDSIVKYDNKFIYVGEYNKRKKEMTDVLIIEYQGKVKKITTAEKAVREGNFWYLLNGRFYLVDKNGLMKFDSSFKKLKLEIDKDFGRLVSLSSPQKMTHSELVEVIKSIDNKKRAAKWIVELHNRYSTSLASIIIVLVGLSLSMLFNLTSKSWGVILTFVLVVLYQGSSAWISALGKEYLINPILASWLPDITFGITGLVLFVFIDTAFIQRLREFYSKILVFAFVIILTSTYFGSEYKIVADNTYIDDVAATFVGNVEIYEKDDKIAEAPVGVYYFDQNILELFNATIVGDSGFLKVSTLTMYENFGQAFHVKEGLFETDEGTITINSATFIIQSANREDLFFFNSVYKLSRKTEDVLFITKFIILNTKTSTEVSAKDSMGRISLTDKKGNHIEGMVARYKDNEALGFEGFIDTKIQGKKKRLYISGSKIKFEKNNIFKVQSVYVTTCNDPNPHYYLSSEFSEISPGKYLVSRNIFLTIFDLPIMYFPFFYQSLEDKPSFKMGLKVSYEKSGINSFYFHTKYSNTGESALSIAKDKDGNTKYSLSISDKILDNPFTISHSKSGASDNFSFKFTFKNLKKTSLSLKTSNSSSSYTYSTYYSPFRVPIYITVNRKSSGNLTSWLLPGITVKKVSKSFLGAKLTLSYIKHKSYVSYEEGDLFSHLDDVKHDGALSLSLSKGLIKEIGSSMSVTNVFKYTFSSTDLTYYKSDSTAKLNLFSKEIKTKFIALKSSQNFQYKETRVKDKNTEMYLYDNASAGININLFNILKSSIDYKRSSSYKKVENEDDNFEKLSTIHKSNVSLSFKLPIIGLALSAKSSYDFLKAEDRWEDPLLTSSYSTKFGDLSLSFSASTKYHYREDKPIDSVSISMNQNYKGNALKNSVSFTYHLNQEKPIKEIVDKFSTKSFELFDRKFSLSGNFKIRTDVDPIKLYYFYVKGYIRKGKVKSSITFKYNDYITSDRKYISLSYGVKGSDPYYTIKTSLNYDGEKWQIPSFTLSLTKSLHKWVFSTALKLSYRDSLSISKFSISFKLSDFPDKYLNYDIMTGDMDFGLM